MRKIYACLLPMICFLLIHSSGYAQLDSCNVFLKGNHFELGICPSGTIGSTVMQPAGYHGNQMAQGADQYPCSFDMFTTRLGIVSDPGLTGWSSYYGDFVSTSYNIYGYASPYEAYLFTENDSVAFVYNMSTNHISDSLYNGENVGYSSTGGTISATYQNVFDSIQLTQVVTLDTGALYAKFTITLTNTSVNPKNNLMYGRVIYTNNDYVQTSNFGSRDSVVYNCPSDPYCLVTSRGMTDSAAYLALGSADTNSRCFIDSTWPLSVVFGAGAAGDQEALTNLYAKNYNHNSWAYYSGGGSGSNAIGIVFRIPHLASVDSAADSVGRTTTAMHPANTSTFSFFYSAGSGASNQALGITTTTTAITNINSGQIKVYPNPAANVLNIEGLQQTDRIQLTDCMGRCTRSWQATGSGTNTFSVAGLITGYYVLVVSDAQGNIKTRTPIEKI